MLAGSVRSYWTVIRNKQILIDEDTCWKFGGDEVPGGSEGLGERLSFKVKGER